MDRRDFLKNSAAIAVVGMASPSLLQAKETESPKSVGKLITSAPMLQNYAEESMGIAFAVSDMANGFVRYGLQPDLSDAKLVKCGGFRVTDMNPDVMLIRLTGLQRATTYYYQIGADRISYRGGYQMSVVETEVDPVIYSFTTAGEAASPHFCVINDTHAVWDTFDKELQKIASIAPSCVLWNGDATNVEEKIDNLKTIFLNPPVSVKEYASRTPYLFCPGNHDARGMASRHLEKVWMFRQPEERLSRDWDLGRNFAIRIGDIALVGLDTAEDKVDENPAFAGLFNSAAYREAQTLWLEDVLERPDIKSAPFLVAACHIPLFETDPRENPGDVHPNDWSKDYKHPWASWQRDCFKMWGPLLHRHNCQLVITAHQHAYRKDLPTEDRCWTHIVGGTHDLTDENVYPTVIEVQSNGAVLIVKVHDVKSDCVRDILTFEPRRG